MNVLIIDDDADALTIMRTVLERRGHTVTAVSTPFGTTSYFSGVRGPRPDVVVLDYLLPGLSGANLLTRWAADASARQVPVILYSNVGAATLLRAAARHPRCTVVEKGSGTRALEDALRAVACA